MRTSLLAGAATLLVALALPGSALAAKATLLTGGENCGVGPSVDGELAVAQDEWIGTIAWYDLQHSQRHDTGIVVDGWAVPSMAGTAFAYFDGDWSVPYTLHIYDTADGSDITLPIQGARPSMWDERPNRYFDGQHVTYWDSIALTQVLYTVADGTMVDLGVVWNVTLRDGLAVYEGSDGVSVYDIAAGTTTLVSASGVEPAYGNGVVVVLDDLTGELVAHDLARGTTTHTGLDGWSMYQWDSDGETIAYNIRGETIKVWDIGKAKLTDTGQHGCSGSDSCWLVISGKHLFYERWEGGTDAWDESTNSWVEVHPPEDLDLDGFFNSCAILWIKL